MRAADVPFGKLVKIEPRIAWPTEAGHFTPWLALEENLRLLGEAIGLELELEATEKDVGPFRADLLCRDTSNGSWVLIENQLERTDHSHLGQLLTYAAGLKAVTVVWVANPFTQEHRAALDWLNEITDARINFFGLEVELWRIGDSPVAPKFNVVSEPNDWSRSVTEAASHELTDAKALQQRFWTGFREYVQSRNTSIRPTKPLPQNWMNIALGRTGFGLVAVFSMWNSESGGYDSGEVRAEMVITADPAEKYFALLEGEKPQVEEELGYGLIWHNPESTSSAKVYVRKTANVQDERKWPELYSWLLKHLEDLRRIYRPRVLNLTLPEE